MPNSVQFCLHREHSRSFRLLLANAFPSVHARWGFEINSCSIAPTVSDTVEIKYSAAAAIFVIQTRRELTYLKRFSLLVLVRILLFVVVHAPEDSFSYLLICQSSFFGHETTYCL